MTKKEKEIAEKNLQELYKIMKSEKDKKTGCDICIYRKERFCSKNSNIYFHGNSCMFFCKVE